MIWGIEEGVEKGIFGLGELDNDRIICWYYEEKPPMIQFSNNEILIKKDVCKISSYLQYKIPKMLFF